MDICDHNSFFRRLIVLLHNSRGGLRNWYLFFSFPTIHFNRFILLCKAEIAKLLSIECLFQNSHPLNQEQSSMVHGLSLWTSEWTLLWQSHTFYFAIDHCISTRKRTYHMIAKKKKSKRSPFKLLKWNDLYMKYRINNQIHK